MWHYGGAEYTTTEIDALPFDDRRRWNVSIENFTHRSISNVRKLNAEAYYYAQNEDHNKIFESTQSTRRPTRTIKNENDKHVKDGDNAPPDERYFYQQVERDGRTYDLRFELKRLSKRRTLHAHLGNIGCDYSALSNNVQNDIQPPWKIGSTVLREVEASHSSQAHSQ